MSLFFKYDINRFCYDLAQIRHLVKNGKNEDTQKIIVIFLRVMHPNVQME